MITVIDKRRLLEGQGSEKTLQFENYYSYLRVKRTQESIMTISMYYQHFKEYRKIHRLLLSDDFPKYKDNFITFLQDGIRESFDLISNSMQLLRR